MRKITIAAAFLTALGAAFFIKARYAEWVLYPPLRAHVNNHMKDPNSTKYRNEYIAASGWLCGEMNSKNGMGGYSGFRRYMSNSSRAAYLDEHGPVGETSSADFLAILEERNGLLRDLLELKKATPSLPLPSESEQGELAVKRFFDAKWKQLCVPKRS